jgi:DNA primase
MVDFDYLRHVSHSTPMQAVLEYYGIEYHNAGTDRYKCVCPFHDDHDPSLIIYTTSDHKDESFCCYVDNNAGDPFLFIRLMEGGDFNQSWAILCHLNGIVDSEASEIDRLDTLLRPSREESSDKRSINTINYQISTMYRNLYKQKLPTLDVSRLKELAIIIDSNYQLLDGLLSKNPSYAELHQHYKRELDRLKQLQQSF